MGQGDDVKSPATPTDARRANKAGYQRVGDAIANLAVVVMVAGAAAWLLAPLPWQETATSAIFIGGPVLVGVAFLVHLLGWVAARLRSRARDQ